MKKIIITVSIFIGLFLVSCSQALVIQTTNPIWVMDTTIDITFYNVDKYEKHYAEIKKIYELYDKISNNFCFSDGNVYALNEQREITASPELVELVNFSLEMVASTNGYYNPLIGRLSKLWKEAIAEEKIVSDEVIVNELAIMNTSKLVVSGNKIAIHGNADLDLGGIAKGFATQKAKEYLAKEKVTSFLINAGQSNVVLGTKHNEKFKVSLDAPYSFESILILNATNLSIASSSGKYQNTIIDKVRYHHLLNPFTGKPATIYDSVNILCADSGIADAYSTAVFMMDLEKAKKFASSKNIDILLYKDSSIVYQTSGWASYA